jgi:hypothetical protein
VRTEGAEELSQQRDEVEEVVRKEVVRDQPHALPIQGLGFRDSGLGFVVSGFGISDRPRIGDERTHAFTCTGVLWLALKTAFPTTRTYM